MYVPATFLVFKVFCLKKDASFSVLCLRFKADIFLPREKFEN